MSIRLIPSILVFFLLLNLCPLAANNEELVTTQPNKMDKALVNPYTGFAPSADGGPYNLPHSLVYANITWRELEPQKGVYNFTSIEKKYRLEDWSKENVKIIIRIVLDYPGTASHIDIPDWLYKEIHGDGTHYTTEWGKGFSPDYNNPQLISNHKSLIKNLGERYNGDERIAFIELGSIGHWGEWHTIQDESLTIPFPKLKVTNQYVMPYVHYFPNKMLLMRRPYPLANKYHMGLFNDMFGNEEHTIKSFKNWIDRGYNLWLTGERHPPMKDYWKHASSGGEFDPNQAWDKLFSRPQFTEVISQAKETHVSWLGPNVPIEPLDEKEAQKNVETFLQTIGYQLRIAKEIHRKELTAGEHLTMAMEWKNDGVAPFYFPWPIEISLLDLNGRAVAKQKTSMDIRKLIPGSYQVFERLQIPNNIPSGEYKVAVAILNPETNTPAIRLKMAGMQEDGRYALGPVIVKNPNERVK
ncbi:DUF4832 domain-containing protein [Bacillus sp. V5-8f]|uniref:DUF4832 domain-containing protein n=1 Tax=Bacillus sp. V5-8f TaxID=2053044 RepID=UPI000C765E27|nr:DUF4832 domain-containing protein [Bacillus sp. V5-8f]PLT32607.1 hypothetical protein CUU64_18225 [Bacillus sp. V5-8f]